MKGEYNKIQAKAKIVCIANGMTKMIVLQEKKEYRATLYPEIRTPDL